MSETKALFRYNRFVKEPTPVEIIEPCGKRGLNWIVRFGRDPVGLAKLKGDTYIAGISQLKFESKEWGEGP